MKRLCILLAIGLLWFGYSRFTAPVTYPPGILVGTEPQQLELPPATPAISFGAYRLQPLAEFEIEARVLHRRKYKYDPPSKLSPLDLAVGWGAMSNQEVLDRLKISQSMRFYFYEYQNPPPIPQDEITRHSTNMHIIPANDGIAAACKALRVGDLARLEGQLVEATGPGIGTWRSSLRRDDSGNGACEIFLVQQVSKLDPDETRAPQPAHVVSR